MSKIFVLINPVSGPKNSIRDIVLSVQKFWDCGDSKVWYQFSKDKNDGVLKIRKATEEGAEVVLLAGGDGMINSLLDVLVETKVTVGLIPTGSVNGFARHFDTPLDIHDAVKVLANGSVKKIDVIRAWIMDKK